MEFSCVRSYAKFRLCIEDESMGVMFLRLVEKYFARLGFYRSVILHVDMSPETFPAFFVSYTIVLSYN